MGTRRGGRPWTGPSSSGPPPSGPSTSATASAPRPSRVSRRALLLGAGAAGLAVGTGIGVAATELAHGGEVSAGLASPGEELMVEHGILTRLLLAYRAMADRLREGRPLSGDVVTDAAGVISDYVESFHEGLEEGYVFPRVAPHRPELVRTLLVQHDRGRHLTASIQAAAAGNLTATRTRSALAGYLAAFVRMYEPHEAWEDTVVFPLLRTLTPQRTLDELAERFAELQEREYGEHALATRLARITSIEQRLGIADLAAFTPPPQQ